MLDLAIAGGGLCGLALAHHVKGLGKSFALFEARPRFGGRIFSARGSTGVDVDLGPSWFWPATQPMISRLASALGQVGFPQHDSGAVLLLNAPGERPEALEGQTVHNGARRVQGGMGALVEAMVRQLPADALHLEHELTQVTDRGDHVELRFLHGANDGNGAQETVVAARRAALAIPPRLLEERVWFDPPLDGATAEAMRRTYTWMSAQAKVVVVYDQPPGWREAGISGNAFVNHGQAVLSEIFDACDQSGRKAALGGFLALPHGLRQQFRAGLPMLIDSQMAQLFGPDFDHGEQHYLNWAEERYTCSALDRIPPASHPEYGEALLARPLWGGKLFLGSSETALSNGGYMEGALNAAARIEGRLMRDYASQL